MTFKVRIEPSGHEFTVADQETILEGALRHGYTLPYSCRNGSCGACKGRLLAGDIDYGKYEDKALSAAERAAGLALFCQAVPRSDVVIEARELAAVAGITIKTLPARVMKMERAADDVMILSLKLPANQRLQFLAGQYLDILLKDGKRRSFSLANPPHEDEFLQLHIRRVPDGLFTTHVFTQMKQKDLLRLRGPMGTFFLREDSDRPVILIGGGTGFAPIKSMLEHAFARDISRPLHFYWGVRARRDLYMHALPQAWARTHANFRYTPVLSEPGAGDAWDGRTGWVHAAVLADYPDLSGHEVYASGPPPMIAAIKQAFFARGLTPERLFYDSFEFAHAGV
ncbi:MAG: CDP-6-deoxy-delta-3,4-glucoseen reductase [Gammaproteobacteria bacterium]|nr:CDP-6-deoxy-delta-3,4-glucoseen reductase [Gammaproteobacteria bacterium]